VPIVEVSPKLNHDARRKLRIASQRVNKHAANKRGVKKHQRVVLFVGVGATGKALDRLQELATREYAA
jgi:hypothetical protein